MKEIPLTQGKVAIVDDADYDKLSAYKWFAHKHKGNVCFYARRQVYGANKKTILMHAEIVGTPTGMQTDHINGDGLDNRRENLRICTNQENHQNRHEKKTSSFPGVCWHKKSKRWVAKMWEGKHQRYLGSFKSESDAARAYRNAYDQFITKGGAR